MFAFEVFDVKSVCGTLCHSRCDVRVENESISANLWCPPVCAHYICINVKIMALPPVQHARTRSSTHFDVVLIHHNRAIENEKHFKFRTNDSNQNGIRHAYKHCSLLSQQHTGRNYL